MFVPGQEGFDQQDSRTAAVLARILALDEAEVEMALDDVVARFGGRHRDLLGTFRRHAAAVADRLEPGPRRSPKRGRLLLGATFTSEYAIEGAALCNPSIVAHPDQSGVPSGQPALRDERPGRRRGPPLLDRVPDRDDRRHRPGRRRSRPAHSRRRARLPVPLDAATFRSELDRLGSDGENTDFVLDPLGRRFATEELEARLDRLQANLATRTARRADDRGRPRPSPSGPTASGSRPTRR